MKIFIDCRSLRKKPAGVPNFLISAINALSAREENWTFLLASNGDFSAEVKQQIVPRSNVIKIISPLPIFGRIAIIWYVLKVPFLVKKHRPDIFFTPIPNLPIWLPPGVKTLIGVHDMVYKYFPKTMSAGNWWINFLLHDRSIRNADFLWAVSGYTAAEIRRLFPTRRSEAIFTGSAINKDVFFYKHLSDQERRDLLKRYHIGTKFLLFTGTLEPRKNLGFLISLMPALVARGFSLLIIGAKGWGSDAQLVAQTEKIRFTGFIPSTELANLYLAADVYVSSSLNEGFGMPQLEAMSCGCPVVCPHNSAMVEIVHGAGETVIGWDQKIWVETIERVSKNREAYVARSLKKASLYDWNVIAKNLAEFLT